MDHSQLIEKKAHEIDKSSNIAKSISQSSRVSIREFYPELKLEGTYGHYIFGKPIYTLIPYLDNVLIDLPPYKNMQVLEEKMGVDFDTLLELIEKKRVSVTLDSDPLHYQNLDYLDPILEFAPSAEIRNSGYLTAISDSYEELLSESRRLFTGKLSDFSKEVGWNRYVNRSGNEIEHTGINVLAQIGALGYHDTYQRIVEKGRTDPATAYRWAYFYSGFLSDPVFCSLDGITPFDRTTMQKEMRSVGSEAKNVNIDQNRFMDFPTDVGRVILNKLEIYLPKNLDLALEVDSEELRKLLREMDSRIEHREELQFEELYLEAERAVNEAMESFESLNSTSRKVSNPRYKKLAELSLGVTGLAAMFFTNKPLFFEMAMLGISVEALSVPELFMEKIMRFRKPSHIVAMIDIRKKLAAHKQLRS